MTSTKSFGKRGSNASAVVRSFPLACGIFEPETDTTSAAAYPLPALVTVTFVSLGTISFATNVNTKSALLALLPLGIFALAMVNTSPTKYPLPADVAVI